MRISRQDDEVSKKRKMMRWKNKLIRRIRNVITMTRRIRNLLTVRW
jgi:hypothetical protein